MLIRGGTVVDPGQGLHARRDVRLDADRIIELGDGLTPRPGEEVVDARDRLVLPGLIDLHVHVFWGASHYGIEPDPHCLGTGTTTVVDAGSAGAHTFARVPPLRHRRVVHADRPLPQHRRDRDGVAGRGGAGGGPPHRPGGRAADDRGPPRPDPRDQGPAVARSGGVERAGRAQDGPGDRRGGGAPDHDPRRRHADPPGRDPERAAARAT